MVKVCCGYRAPRFKGFQQQDSHELLRHLMDGMKAEEVKVTRSLCSSFDMYHALKNLSKLKKLSH